MPDITIHSEPGKFPAIELQPGNTLVVTLAGTDVIITVHVPLMGFPSANVFSKSDYIDENYTFVTKRLQDRLRQVAEEGEE